MTYNKIHVANNINKNTSKNNHNHNNNNNDNNNNNSNSNNNNNNNGWVVSWVAEWPSVALRPETSPRGDRLGPRSGDFANFYLNKCMYN